MKRNWFWHFKTMLLMGLTAALLGTILLTIVFCLPKGKMQKNVAKSLDVLVSGRDTRELGSLSSYIREKRDYFTDAIIAENAFLDIPGKNAYEHALWMYHLDLSDQYWTPEDSLAYLCEEKDTTQMYLLQYSRYWHGYLVYLKPFLMGMSFQSFLILEAGILLLLLFGVVFYSLKKGCPQIGVALGIGLLFMKPILMGASVVMSVCFGILLLALLIQIRFHKQLTQKELYPEFFLAIGIAVAYFDFLTYPIATLGFPLCAYFLLNRETKGRSLLLRTVMYSISWGLGYVGMWGMKWLIADVTLQTGTIKSAVSSILGWTESVGGRPRFNGGFYVLELNHGEYQWPFYGIFWILLLVFDLFCFWYAAKKKQLLTKLSGCLPFVVIYLLPYAWFLVVQHHSALHVTFTFRIIGVSAAALCAMGLKLLEKAEDEE